MNSFLVPAAATALILTGTQAATAVTSCGMNKTDVHRAVMAHQGSGYHGYGIPNAYPAGYHSQAKHGGYGYKGQSQGGYGYHGRSMEAKADLNTVEVAVSAGSFSSLVTAVKAAGLVETLPGNGPFTVFAPSDEAVAKLPAGTLEGLLADKAKLAQILTYHIVPGKLDSSAVTGVSKLVTVEGSELPVSSLKIAETDVLASNGVIHVIDEVLFPEA